MKNDTIIELFTPTPKLLTRKCQLIAKTIEYLLKSTSFVITLAVWYLYDYFIAGATFFMMFIIMGIIRAKLRDEAIPQKQREYQYNDEGLSIWFTARHFCIEKEVD